MRKLLIITMLLSFTAIKAQQIKPYYNTISVENGLPEGYIVSSLQDKLGYMWFGTQNGLVRYDGYELKSYSFPDENGDPLIRYSIRHLHEDKEGKLWVLVRNTGLFYLNRQIDSFIKVKLAETDLNIFKHQFFRKWVEDPKNNRHWFLALDVKNFKPNLFVFDAVQNTFKKYGPKSESDQYLPSYESADILMDLEGTIWASADTLLSFFDLPSNSFKPWFVIPDTTKSIIISGITSDPINKDMLWVNTYIQDDDSGNNSELTRFYHVNKKTKEYKSFKHFKNDPSSIAGNCIQIINDSLNRSWFITGKGISLYNNQSGSFTNYNLDLPKTTEGQITFVEAISADNEGNLWLGGTFNGLIYLNVETAKSIMYSHTNTPGSIPDSPRGINKLFYDRAGTFWVFMPWRGVAFLDHQKSLLNPIFIEPDFNTVTAKTDLDDYIISGKKGDNIFFVNNASGLLEWNTKLSSFKRIELNNDEVYKQITTVHSAKDGLIWIGSRSAGLFCYKPVNKSVKNFINDPTDSISISSNSITVMIDDKKGNLWIGTVDQGLCRFNKTSSTFTRFPFITNNGTIIPDNKLDDQRVLSLYFDKQEILWIGTNLGGLNKFDPKTEKLTSYLDPKAGFSCVINIYEDSHNQLWAGTYLTGIFLFNRETGSIKRFSEQNGLLFNAIMGITEDNRSNIWVASVRGLSMIIPESNTIINYPTTIGDLLSNDILYSGKVGQIELTVNNGLVSFYPEKMNASNIPPSIVIESISYTNANDRDTTIYTDSRDHIELKFNENKIRFQYVALHYAHSDLNQYEFKLEGHDKDWIESGKLRSTTYTNLSPGEYTFHVKAANSDGVWNKTGSSISILISPPWWLTTLAYIIYALLFIAGVFVVDRYQRKRLKEKARALAREKELAQAKEIEKAYTKLKATQSQLIQSEKMASLGELTAGIAHEIQNPLNFVNNFSEVSVDLMEEMNDEIAAGNLEVVNAITDDLNQNLVKIHHHGKRASSIVKGMLEHSRVGDGNKEPADINEMADEYLRLAYHGLRAKDNSFNADFKTDFDQSLQQINLIPQDFGRVLLNLVNNAFFAVDKKAKGNIKGYKPQVVVRTKKLDGSVEIQVQDNGLGIPAKIKDKIFQPFFTTKPTGEGTGLGLSLSYDIITKGHGGELKVETIEKQGTTFIINIPVNN